VTYKRILVPVDGSKPSNLGLREAMRLARGQRARLQLVHVVDQHYALMSAPEAGAQIGAVIQALKQGGRRVLRSAEARVKAGHVPCTSVLLETLARPAADLIVRQAKKWRADLIVLGTHGRRGVSRLVMGSDAEQIVRTSPVPVMLVRAGK
jgi:nucleotide-binding universal stress UspA family protein